MNILGAAERAFERKDSADGLLYRLAIPRLVDTTNAYSPQAPNAWLSFKDEHAYYKGFAEWWACNPPRKRLAAVDGTPIFDAINAYF